MAPSLPSCISSTFCSHKQASWFLLATLSPFFLPFLILCVPFLLLFLAPVSFFLVFLLLLYKVQVYMCPKLLRFHRRRHKGVLSEGYEPTQQIAAAERLDVHQQAPLEEDREFKGLEAYTHHKEGDGAGSCILPSRVCDFEEEKLGHVEEDIAAQDGITEDKLEKKQDEQDIIGGPSVEEVREERSPGGFSEREGPEVSDVWNVELPAAPVQEGMRSPEREGIVTELTQEGMGKEVLRNDMAEDSKQEEVERAEESIDFKDEQKDSPLYVETTSSGTSEEKRVSLPLTYESESFDTPQEGRNERPQHPLEEAWSKLPAIQVPEPSFQVQSAVFPGQIVEKPGGDELHEQFEIDTPFTDITHEHIREEPELSSQKESSLEILGGYEEGPAEPFEKEVEEGETSYSSPEGQEQWRREAFDKEKGDYVQPHKGGPAKDLAESSAEREEGYPSEPTSSAVLPAHVYLHAEGEEGYPSEGTSSAVQPPHVYLHAEGEEGYPSEPTSSAVLPPHVYLHAEGEEGYLSEGTSSAVPPPHEYHGGVEFQDRIQQEQKIMADINAIKKIVGYQGEPHASIMEQISALYMFLGMEPYNWGAEVDNLERAQAEIELLKVVVGVK